MDREEKQKALLDSIQKTQRLIQDLYGDENDRTKIKDAQIGRMYASMNEMCIALYSSIKFPPK